jgi:general secretion pathway protein C
MAKKQRSNKIVSKVPYWVEAFVVKLSLQNPDYGASRLVPLLENEGITVTTSAVYNMLKRNNLQNRSLRLAKLDEQGTAEVVPESANNMEPPSEDPDPAQKREQTPESRVTLRIKAPSKPSVRRPWSLTVPNLLLLAIVGYFWVSAAANYLQAGREPILASQAPPMQTTSKAKDTVRPLEDFGIIYERNLFGASEGQASAPHEELSVEDIPTAEKGLGLKLVGTVAGDDSATSFAVIDNKKTRKQELYHEGDKAGEVLIKKILRSKVIVDAGKGEELLALELEETGNKIDSPSAAQSSKKSFKSTARHKYLRLDRKEVEASLADIDGLIQQVRLTPYTLGNQPRGFMISDIPPGSVLTKMGLQNGSVIRAINDEPITGPEQAAAFFQKIREGGDIEIRVTKRRRTMRVNLQIE